MECFSEVVKGFPYVLSCFLPSVGKERHSITACIGMEHRENLWFDCTQWECNRMHRNVSQVAPCAKCCPEFGYIDGWNDWDGDGDYIRINSANHNFLASLIDRISSMHKHSCISLFMIAGGEGTCIVCVCAENIFIVCCDHRLISLYSFDLHGKEGKKVRFIFVPPKKFLPVVWHTNIPCNHSPDALASLGPSVCFQAVVLVCIPYYVNWVDPLQLGFHIWKYFLQGVITEDFTTCWTNHVHDHCPIQNYTITFWNLSLGISFTL